MKFQDKKQLQALLAALPGSGQQLLRKRAETERNEIMRQFKRAPSMDELMLNMLLRERAEPEQVTVEEEAKFSGLVVGLTRKRATVLCDDIEVSAPLVAELAQMQKSAIAVGDMVRMDGDPLMVQAVLPRRTKLSRPDPGAVHIERVLAANIDVVGLVTSVKFPPMRVRLLERALLAIQRGGARPIIIANKVDMLSPDERETELARLQPFGEQGILVIPCSAATGEGMPELRAAFAGSTCVFVGHSGVGKSSLLNALDSSLTLVTGELRKGDGKGRHTTTASHLYHLEGGIRLIDTPGVRAFGLWKMTPEEIRDCFCEFGELADDCAFSNCSHTHEPRCAVKQAVEQGEITAARYSSYERLLRDDEE
ncbi:MAG: ribosome small subunit-dependent GTPase A [bacterium]